MLACVAVAVLSAATAYDKMVACSATNGAPPFTTQTNTTSPQHPAGIFDMWNFCSGQGGDPPGESSFLRIQEQEPSGSAGASTAMGPGTSGRLHHGHRSR